MSWIKQKEINGHAASVYAVDGFGQFIYSGSSDKFVARWNLATGIQDKFAIKFEQAIYSLTLVDNQRKLAVGLANGDLHVFDLENRTELKFYQQHTTNIYET